MRKQWKVVVGVAVAALALTVVAGTALAQGPRGANGAQAGTGVCGGVMGQYGVGGPAWGQDATLGAVTGLIGLTEDEIIAERQAGKSLADIAGDKGVTEEQLVNAILDSKGDVLAERVAAGTLTQAQADAMLANMTAMVTANVNRTTTGPVNGSGARGQGRGMMRGGRSGAGLGLGTCGGVNLSR